MALAGQCAFLISRWPFSRSAVLKSLESASDAPVEIGSFRQVFFPYPGCVANGVVIHRASKAAPSPLITIDTLAVRGDYFRLFILSRSLKSIRTQGMHIRILTDGAARGKSAGKLGIDVSVDELTAERTTLEFNSLKPGETPFVLSIHDARLAPVSGHQALSFATDLRTPEPAGEVHADGRFGPWNISDPFETPVSGGYSYSRADLGFASGIAGLLDSTGRFHGVIRRIEVQGSTDVPDFAVQNTGHQVKLVTAYRAVVNGKTGDVALQSVNAHFRRSAVAASGDIADRSANDGKQVSLQLSVPEGRVEDFLYLFTQGASPGLSGGLNLRCDAAIPPGRAPFLQKLRMNLTFRISRARFTSPQTQQDLDRISRRAQGDEDGDEQGPDVLSNFAGKISLAGGIARITDVTFAVPGATARLSGAYDLLRQEVNLRGIAHLDVSISKTQRGFKSFLLKVAQPFIQKKRAKGADVPIKITGRWGHASLGLDIAQKL